MPMRIMDKKKMKERDRADSMPQSGRERKSSNIGLEAGGIEAGGIEADTIFGSTSDSGSESNACNASDTISETARSLPNTGKEAIKSDVLGSYTGTDLDFGAPVQDADDL